MPRPRVASKEHILRATLDVFRERGYEGTTVPAIARRAGISQGTLYNYFPSKEKLLFACARAEGSPGSIFAGLTQRIGAEPITKQLEEAAAGIARFYEIRLPSMLMRAASPSLDRPGLQYPRRSLEAARDYFAAAIKARLIRNGDPRPLAAGFVGGVFYAAFFDRVYGLPRSFGNRDHLARAWAREFAAGLRRPRSA